MQKNRLEMVVIPYKFKKPCQFPSCPELTHRRFCKKHNNHNSEGRSKPYNFKWKKEREAFLKLNPLCVRCHNVGELVKATVADHIIPHRGNMDLFWDITNWQALCESCHNKKSRNEDRIPVYKF